MFATASCSFFAALFFGQACWPQPLVAHPQHHHVAAIHQRHHFAVIPLPMPSPLKKTATQPIAPVASAPIVEPLSPSDADKAKATTRYPFKWSGRYALPPVAVQLWSSIG